MGYRITIENLRRDIPRDKPYGNGSPEYPFKIESKENLIYLSTNQEMITGGYHFVQYEDITFNSGEIFSPIGFGAEGVNTNSFNGNYDGNGYSISNITIDPQYVAGGNTGFGLFGKCYKATIKNVTVNNITINDSYSPSHNNFCGGICGIMFLSNIENCSIVNSEINSTFFSGGICGYAVQSSVYQCQSVDNLIKSLDNSGGIVGNLVTQSRCKECYSRSDDIIGTNYTGGVVARIATTTFVENCYSGSHIKSTSGTRGGLIGGCLSGVTNCYSSTLIDGTGGGLIGWSDVTATVDSSYWDTQSSGQSTSDGGIGKTTAEMQNVSTFVGWDFTDTWDISSNNYPNLVFEGISYSVKENYFEYQFEYPIIKDSVKYDPESYISYDYMVSTARLASFNCYVGKNIQQTGVYNYIKSIMSVNDDTSINDIIMYNYFYYDTDDDSEKLIQTSGKVLNVGEELTDENGLIRTISSIEKISEGLSTLYCRIYEFDKNNTEQLRYSGFINKENVSLKDEVLSIGLVDSMYLVSEISKKFSVVVSSDAEDGYKFISFKSSVDELLNNLVEVTELPQWLFDDFINERFKNNQNVTFYGEDIPIAIFQNLDPNNRNDNNAPFFGEWFNNNIFKWRYNEQDIFGNLDLPYEINYRSVIRDEENIFQVIPTFETIYRGYNYSSYDWLTGVSSTFINNKYGMYLFHLFFRVIYSRTFNGVIYLNNFFITPKSCYVNSETQDTPVSDYAYGFINIGNRFSNGSFVIVTDTQLPLISNPQDDSDHLQNLLIIQDELNDKLVDESEYNDITYLQYKDSISNSIKRYFSESACEYLDTPIQKIEENDLIENSITSYYGFNNKINETVNIVPNGEVWGLADVAIDSLVYSMVAPLFDGTYSIYDLLKIYSYLTVSNIKTNNAGNLQLNGLTFSSITTILINDSEIYKPFNMVSVETNAEKGSQIADIYEGNGSLKQLYQKTYNLMDKLYVDLFEKNNISYAFKVINRFYQYVDNEGQFGFKNIEIGDKILISGERINNVLVYVTELKPSFNNEIIDIKCKEIQE
jgi:hypothetical protein